MAETAVNSSSFEGVLATRYLSAAGLTVLIYDHLLTLDKEKQYIWPSKAGLVKWPLILNKYLVAIALIINSHALSGLSSAGLTTFFCRTWWSVIAFLAILSIAICHGIIILKLWKLWGGMRSIILLTTIAFAFTEVTSIITMGFTAKDLWTHAVFSEVLGSCALAVTPPTLKVVWAILVAFDLFAFLMVLFNALSRPREVNTHLFKVLIHDGVLFFIVISVLGWLNLISNIVAPTSKGELGIFCIWAMAVTLVSRMILNLREAESMRHSVQNADCYEEMEEDWEEIEVYELHLKPSKSTMLLA